jgi:hypothetical protein
MPRNRTDLPKSIYDLKVLDTCHIASQEDFIIFYYDLTMCYMKAYFYELSAILSSFIFATLLIQE